VLFIKDSCIKLPVRAACMLLASALALGLGPLPGDLGLTVYGETGEAATPSTATGTATSGYFMEAAATPSADMGIDDEQLFHIDDSWTYMDLIGDVVVADTDIDSITYNLGPTDKDEIELVCRAVKGERYSGVAKKTGLKYELSYMGLDKVCRYVYVYRDTPSAYVYDEDYKLLGRGGDKLELLDAYIVSLTPLTGPADFVELGTDAVYVDLSDGKTVKSTAEFDHLVEFKLGAGVSLWGFPEKDGIYQGAATKTGNQYKLACMGLEAICDYVRLNNEDPSKYIFGPRINIEKDEMRYGMGGSMLAYSPRYGVYDTDILAGIPDVTGGFARLNAKGAYVGVDFTNLTASPGQVFRLPVWEGECFSPTIEGGATDGIMTKKGMKRVEIRKRSKEGSSNIKSVMLVYGEKDTAFLEIAFVDSLPAGGPAAPFDFHVFPVVGGRYYHYDEYGFHVKGKLVPPPAPPAPPQPPKAPTGSGNGSSGGSGGGGNSGGGGGGGGGAGGGAVSVAPAAAQWLEPAPAGTLSAGAAAQSKGQSGTKGAGQYGVRASSWGKLAGKPYRHDTLENNSVKVRVTVSKPEQFKNDALVSGYVSGPKVDRTQKAFEKLASNKLKAIHFDQQGLWEQPVTVAARVDLKGMDTAKLCFYHYDAKANRYTRMAGLAYRVDANGYLHFTTGHAGDIVISEGPLARR
jgi:hypothetical protein